MRNTVHWSHRMVVLGSAWLRSVEARGEDEGEDEKKMAVLTTDAPGKLGREVSGRNKMELFTALHSYIPHLPPQIAKAKLTEKNVNYIKFLEKECQTLESRKHAAPNALTATKNFYLVPPCQLSAQNIAFQGNHFWPIN